MENGTKERIEEKINSYIVSIIEKGDIDKDDYSVLTAELGRLKLMEDAKKWEEGQEERVKALVKSFARI